MYPDFDLQEFGMVKEKDRRQPRVAVSRYESIFCQVPGTRCLYFAGDSSAAGGVHRGVALPRPVTR